MPIDDPRHTPAPDESDALLAEIPPAGARTQAGADFAWAFGRPAATAAGDAPAWREFLAPGAGGDDAWVEFLRR